VYGVGGTGLVYAAAAVATAATASATSGVFIRAL